MMKAIVDSSFLVATANAHDRFHAECLALAQEMQHGFIVPVTVLPEAAYLIGSRLGHHIMREFVRQMARPGWITEPVSDDDLIRAAAILDKYSDLNLDFVDATLVAVAERLNVRRVLTLDRRDFRVIRPSHCPSFELLPEI